MNKKDLHYRFENKNWLVEVEWVTWDADPTDHIKATVFNKKTYEKFVAWQDVDYGDTELSWTDWERRYLPKTILKKTDSFAMKIYKQLLKYAEY